MLNTTIEAGVATVVLDLPPLQLVGAKLIGGLTELLPALETEAAAGAVRVAVFRSADPDFFLMHGDVEQLAAAMPAYDPERPAAQPNAAAAIFQRLHRAPFVTIGMIDGAARGGGCEFLSALDLRYGTPRTRIGQPEALLGILPGAGGTVRWPRQVGRARALELILTGRDIAAEEAFAVGWLNALLPIEQLEVEVRSVARRIASLPPSVIVAVKGVVDASLVGLGEALTVESDTLARLLAGGEHQQRMLHFLDAGGQTRHGERGDLDPILEALIEPRSV